MHYAGATPTSLPFISVSEMHFLAFFFPKRKLSQSHRVGMYWCLECNPAHLTPKSLWHVALMGFPFKILMCFYLGLSAEVFNNDSIKNVQVFM